jgi:cytolysin-activating lysine-acyltransferase
MLTQTESNLLKIAAPGLIEQTWNEAEILGGAAWLWMHSTSHRDFPLHALSVLLLPAIKKRQFVFASESGQPVFYMSWAHFNLEAEKRYLAHSPLLMPEQDWNSGDRMWILDWVAPFGHTKTFSRILRQQLFAHRWARTLYHRGDERGLRIKTFMGAAVLPEEARHWFISNPPIN